MLWFRGSFFKWKLSWSSTLLQKVWYTHQQRTYFACKGKHLSPLEKEYQAGMRCELWHHWISYSSFSRLGHRHQIYERIEGKCLRAFWSLPLPSSDRRSRPSVDSACKEMSDGLLDLITVKTLYISGLVAVWPLRWYLFNEPTRDICISIVCSCLQALKLTSIHCEHTLTPCQNTLHTHTLMRTCQKPFFVVKWRWHPCWISLNFLCFPQQHL